MYEMEWIGLEWEIYDTLWELFTYLPTLVEGYLFSWNGWMDGWMDLIEQETNNRRNDFLKD